MKGLLGKVWVICGYPVTALTSLMFTGYPVTAVYPFFCIYPYISPRLALWPVEGTASGHRRATGAIARLGAVGWELKSERAA